MPYGFRQLCGICLRFAALCSISMAGYIVISLILLPVARLLGKPPFEALEKRQLPFTLFKVAFVTLMLLLIPGWRRWLYEGKWPWER